MSAEMIMLEAPEQGFSEYPVKMDEYFQNNEVIIKILPSGYMKDIELFQSDFKVTSAAQYKFIIGCLIIWAVLNEIMRTI